MSFFGSTDFLIEVAKGNVPGHDIMTLVSRNPDVGIVEEDIWFGGGVLVYPTANETWEIVSDSPLDTLGGTGANVVTVRTLDEDYIESTQVVFMNGTTAVTLVGGLFRPQGIVVVSSGATRKNQGTLTLQVSGGGAPRAYVAPLFGNDQCSHYTVPAGKTAISINTTFALPKNGDAIVNGVVVINDPATNTEIITASFPLYQNITTFDQKGIVTLPEKTDTLFRAKGTNPSTEVNVIFVLLIVDNEFVT